MVNENVQILVGGNAVSSSNKMPVADSALLTAIQNLTTAINTLNNSIGVVDDAAVTNPASSGSLIALTKGVLTNTALA